MPRIALAQIDATVGDIAGNSRLVVEAAGAARRAGAELVVFPEMTMTGYPPEDLVARRHFVEANLDALTAIATATVGVDVLVGFVEPGDGVLHNSAALLRDGRIEGVYRKRLLPNYGVFDEERHFEPGASDLLFECGGVLFAVSICEDLWHPGPASEMARAGARVVLNLSASPYHAGKGREREEMFSSRARDNSVWVAFCNLVGGQDELVFDGRSALFAPDGAVVSRAKSFDEDLLVVDVPTVSEGPAARIEDVPGAEAEVYAALVTGVRDYFAKNGFSSAVVGLSGGIDSALTAALAVDALGAAEVHGVLMPSRYSSQGSIDDAQSLCANLGISCVTHSIEGPFQAFLDELESSMAGREPDTTEENLQARVRGSMLMALSNKFGWIVLATGNKSELSVGYSTLYGDMVGGFAPIKDVYKTRVYALARWRNASGEAIPASSLDKPPSAELRPDQLDSDALPPYEVLDAILLAYIEQDRSRDEIAAAGHDAKTVERVCSLVDAAEYKRRQGPLGIKITPKAFGRDRRSPVTNRYRG